MSNYDLNGSIRVYSHNTMTGKYGIIPYGEKDTTFSISIKIPNDIVSSIRIVFSATNDLLSNIKVRRSSYLDLPVSFDTILHSFTPGSISVRQSVNLDYPSSIAIRLSDTSDLSSTIQTRAQSALLSNIVIAMHNFMTGRVGIVQPTPIVAKLSPVQDAFVRERAPHLNYGTDQTMLVGYNFDNDERYRSLVQFDLSSLPTGRTIEKAVLKVYSDLTNIPQTINAVAVTAPWTELGVTWDSQPTIGGVAASARVGGSVGYVEFDITSLVLDWYNGNSNNYGVMLIADDETLDEYQQFNTRESATNKPVLEITYHDPVVSTNWVDVPSNLGIHPPLDLPSSVLVSRAFIDGSVYIKPSFDMPGTITVRASTHNDLPSTAGINKDGISCSIYVRSSRGINGTITVRQTGTYDLESNLVVCILSRPGSIYVRPYFDLEGTITVRTIGTSDIPLVLAVNNPDNFGTVYVRPYTSLDSLITVRAQATDNLPSQVAVSTPQKQGWIYVRPYADVPSTVAVRRSKSADVKSKIVVSIPSITCTINIPYHDDIASSICIRKPAIKDLQSNVYVRFRSDLAGKISVQAAALLNGSIQVNSGYLAGFIRVPYHGYSNLRSRILVRVRWASDLDSTITVNSKAGAYAFIM